MGKLKRIIHSGLRAFGIAALIGAQAAIVASPFIYTCYMDCGREERLREYREMDAKNAGYAKTLPRDDVEKIVGEINTPKEAFEEITKRIKFTTSADSGHYNASLQESFARGEGDCTEGAIAFAALLSDNPEYHARVISLGKKQHTGHYAALFWNPGLGWGYASFNDYTGKPGINAKISKDKTDYAPTLEKAIAITWNDSFEAYQILNFKPNDLKFGRGDINPEHKDKVYCFGQLENWITISVCSKNEQKEMGFCHADWECVY